MSFAKKFPSIILKQFKNWPFALLTLLVLTIYAFFLLDPINLAAQDVGRHITNGREILQGHWSVLFENYYSYSLPNHSFVNHHWFFGVVAFLLEQAFGFAGLHLVHILVLEAAALFLLKLIKHHSNQLISYLLFLPAILFFTTRVEVRPESLGLLFLIHTLWQLEKIISCRKITIQQIWLLLIQQLIWTNFHISFIFGISLPFLLWVCAQFFQSPQLRSKTKQLLLKLGLGLILMSLFNPNFIVGLLQPLAIFTDYGYSVVENQTLLFLWRVIRKQVLFPYLSVTIITLLLLLKHWFQITWYHRWLALSGLFIGFLALRHVPIFVVLAFPVLAKLLNMSFDQLKNKIQINVSFRQMSAMLAIAYGLTACIIFTGKFQQQTNFKNRRLGLMPQQAQAAKFITQQQLPQPIFNNYDLGSYLIYYLYPEYQVFTDNRPEAYGQDFFQETYIPMQQLPEKWQQALAKYKFKTIIFAHRDITPWGVQFLRLIKADEGWQQIYLDEIVVIYVQSTDQDQ